MFNIGSHLNLNTLVSHHTTKSTFHKHPASILEIFEFLWTVGVEWTESPCTKMEALLIDIYISIDIYTYIDIYIYIDICIAMYAILRLLLSRDINHCIVSP